MNIRMLSTAVLVSIVLLLNIAGASIPQLISIQGRLTDAAGVPLAGSHNLTFLVYNASSGGSSLWTEYHNGTNNVTVTNGVFNVLLGSIVALNLPFNESYWLEAVVNGEAQSPRINFTTSAYAFRANKSEGIDCVGCINSTHIAAGAINNTHINITGNLSMNGYNFTNVSSINAQYINATNITISGNLSANVTTLAGSWTKTPGLSADTVYQNGNKRAMLVWIVAFSCPAGNQNGYGYIKSDGSNPPVAQVARGYLACSIVGHSLAITQTLVGIIQPNEYYKAETDTSGGATITTVSLMLFEL